MLRVHRFRNMWEMVINIKNLFKNKNTLNEILNSLALVIITLFNYQFLIFAPNTIVFGDAARFNGYFAMIIKYSLLNYGQFGLWDQFISSGISWISHPSGLQFSPVAWLAILFFNDPTYAARFMELLYVSVAAVSFYFLLRVLNLSRTTSFLASIPYIANQYTFMFGVNGWFEEFIGIMLLPLTTALLYLGLTKKSYIYIFLGSLAMSLNFFDNTYYVFHYNAIALLWFESVLGLKIIWENKQNGIKKIAEQIFFYTKLNVVFWLVFIGISAIKLLPLLEFRDLSARSFISLAEAEKEITSFQVLWERLLNFFIPPGHTTVFTQYANVLGLFFLLISIIYFLKKRTLIYGLFLSLFVIGIWGILASNLPIDLYAFMYSYLPGFNSNKYPFRFIIIAQFAFMVCMALGLDVLINQKKVFLGKILGIFLGLVLFFSTIVYMLYAFSNTSYVIKLNLKDEIKKSNDNNLLVKLSKIIKEEKSEGRMYSTFYSGSSPFIATNAELFLGEIPSVQHSYANVMPTYEYLSFKNGTSQDSLELTKKKYKIFSILNVRYQLQQPENFEYEGCSKLSLLQQNAADALENPKPSEGVCQYLENRLSPLTKTRDGGIYYDKFVLPKIALIPYPMLLISDNRFNDFSGFIAKKIMFHPDFDIKTITILSSKRNFEDYSIDELRSFPILILVDPKVKNKVKFEKTKKEYQKTGKLLELKSNWITYENLHERSGSLWTDKPAWSYSQEDGDTLSEVFKNLSSLNASSGNVSIKKFTPEDLIFEVETPHYNTVLQFSDSYYPGWKAKIDEKQTSLYMADGLVKGVVIPKKGKHIVRMYYSPGSLKIGAAITITTILALISIGIYRLKRDFDKKRKLMADIIKEGGLFFKNGFMNLFAFLAKAYKNFPRYAVSILVLFFFALLFYPIFINSGGSQGDLPYYFGNYLKTLSIIPDIWNPHWPTGLGGNQAIILPLKLYSQFLIPLFSISLGLNWEFITKIQFFAVFIMLSILSSFLLTKSWIGSLIYTTNTWILLVLSGGQMGIALSYALIPLLIIVFKRLIEKFNLERSLVFSLAFSLGVMFDQRIALLSLGIMLFLLIFELPKISLNYSTLRKNLVNIFLLPVIILALNSYWIFPLVFSKIIGSSALKVISGESAQAKFFSFAFFENSISLLHPNWPENIFGKTYFMRPEFLIIAFLAFASLFYIKNNKKILPFALLSLIGAFLAKGTNEPFGAAYIWLFENIPGFNLFRDPTKFYILIALSYSMLIPFAIKKISDILLPFLKCSHVLLVLAFIIFWGFTIRYNFTGSLFKVAGVPPEYVKLKEYIEPQQDFSRALWIPKSARFGYFSDNHPAIDGYDIFGRISGASMAAKLASPETLTLLSELSVKYVIVPYDSQGEIFLTDRKYDEELWNKTAKTLDQNYNLKLVANFGKLRVYENPKFYGHFYTKQALGGVKENVTFDRIRSTKYTVAVDKAKFGDIVVFSEGYDLGWQAMSSGLKVFPVPYNGLLNGFVLPKDGDYFFELHYKPQRAADIGFVVSGITLLSIILVFVLRKKIR